MSTARLTFIERRTHGSTYLSSIGGGSGNLREFDPKGQYPLLEPATCAEGSWGPSRSVRLGCRASLDGYQRHRGVAMTSPSRQTYVKAHTKQKYRKYRCSGSCGVVVEALAESQLWCGQPGCRGSMKPSYPVSSKRLANDQFESAHRRAETPQSTPRFSQLFRSEKCPRLVGASGTSRGDEGALFKGIALAQESLIQTLIDGGIVHWCWVTIQRSSNND